MTKTQFENHFEKNILPEVARSENKPNLFLRCSAWDKELSRLINAKIINIKFWDMPDRFDTLKVRY
jgi:hypothetical protein